MNILILSQFFSTTKGGGEYVFTNITKSLAKNGNNVWVITNKIKNENYEEIQNVHIIFVQPLIEYKGGLPPTFSENIQYVFGAVRKGLSIIKKEKIDLIHSNNFSPALTGSILSSLTSIPHLTTVHDIFSLCGKDYWKKWGKQNDVSGFNVLFAPYFEKLIIKSKHAATHTVSNATKDDLIQFGEKKPIYVIPNSIEIKDFNPTEKNSLQFIYIGRLVFYKNIEVIIKAIKIVTKTYPDIKLIIVGGGPQEKEEQLNELEKIATERADEIKKLAKITTEKEDEIKKLAKTTTEKEEQLNELEKISTERKEQLNELAEISTEREEQLNELEKTSTERKEQLNELEKISTERADEIKKLAKITSEKEDQIEKLKIIGEDKDIQIDIRQKIGVDKDIQIDILQKISGEKEGHITELQKHLQITQDQIRAIHQSIVFRLLRKYDNSIGKVIPLRPKKYLKSTMDELSASDQYKNIKIALETLTLTKKDIICFPIINWDYRIQRSQHLLRKFSQNGHRVFYLKTHLRNLSNPYQIKLLEENIYEVELNSPKFFDIYKDQLDMNLVDNLIFSFQKLSNDLKLDALCFVEFPTWKDLVLRIRTLFNYRIVFDCLDDFASFPGVNSARKNEENSLFELSDLVTTSSDFLKNKASEFTKKIVLLPNAGEHSHFHKTFNENILNQYTKPIVGYFGSIAEWFDTDLIEFLAKERPNFTFVLLGHTFGADIQKLENLSNVHFLGEQPYSELPRYLQDFDACLIPFKMNQLIEATHPVKIYEYFAAGKPVVSTYFPEIEHFRELCYVAKNKDDFLAQLDLAINEKNTKLNKKRIEFSSKNTWDDRFQTLYSQLKKLDSFDILQHRYTSSIIKSKI